MPVYEYRCRSCGHQFEVQQSFSDEPLSVCPQCEGELRKVFAPIGISFKGSGFYKTDSRSAGSFGSTKDADKSDTGSKSNGSSTKTSADSSSSSSSSSGSSSSSTSSSGSSASSTSTASSSSAS